MIMLLLAAIGALLAGTGAIVYGLPVKEFSFGNTVILAGVISICTGVVMFGLWIAVRELRAVARRIGNPAAAGLHDPSLPELSLPELSAESRASRASLREGAAVAPTITTQAPAVTAQAPPIAVAPLPPRMEQADIRAPSADLAPTPVAEPAPAPKRRNLLFRSSVRQDRDRDRERETNPAAASAPVVEAGPRIPVQEGAPQPDRALRPRLPSTFPDPQTGPQPAARPAAQAGHDAPRATLLKSGEVDGMEYKLYSDGSIEAQVQEGMMRFASIEDLRVHLDRRP